MCAHSAGTGLYELWKQGLYRNYAPDKLVDLIARILALVPPWVRLDSVGSHGFAAIHYCCEFFWRHVNCQS